MKLAENNEVNFKQKRNLNLRTQHDFKPCLKAGQEPVYHAKSNHKSGSVLGRVSVAIPLMAMHLRFPGSLLVHFTLRSVLVWTINYLVAFLILDHHCLWKVDEDVPTSSTIANAEFACPLLLYLGFRFTSWGKFV